MSPSMRSFGRSPAVMCRSDASALDHFLEQDAEVDGIGDWRAVNVTPVR